MVPRSLAPLGTIGSIQTCIGSYAFICDKEGLFHLLTCLVSHYVTHISTECDFVQKRKIPEATVWEVLLEGEVQLFSPMRYLDPSCDPPASTSP